MLRGSLLRHGIKCSKRGTTQRTPQRHQSTAPSGGSAGGTLVKITLGVGTLAGAGALGYAKMDSSFAKQLKESAPFLTPVLDMIGADTGTPSTTPPTPKQAIDQSLIRKAKVSEPAPKETPQKSQAPAKQTAKSETSEAQKKESASKDNELRRQKDNFILEQSLRDASSMAERTSSDATENQITAKESTEHYASKLMKALDEAHGSEDHFMWAEANEAKKYHSDVKKRADTKLLEATKALSRLEDAIKKGREDGNTKDNMNIHQAEQTLSRLREKLQTAAAAAQKSMEKVNFAQNFSAAIDEGKVQLMEEVSAMLPAGKNFGDPKSLSTDDLSLLVHHAHTKIQTLQKELSRVHLSDDDRARQYRSQLATLDREMSKQKADLNQLIEGRIMEERELFEVELQHQLTRQVGAHTEHLKEALEDQRAELTRRRQLEVEKAREEERSLQVLRLSEAVHLLQKMEAYLQARQHLDEASKRAKSLWLSCASLKHVLTQGRTSVVDTPQPLAGDVVPLREASESSEFVKVVLQTIPDQALKRGVFPEIAIKNRFYKVETACRRVAMMEDQNGGGPGRYFLSYLMSMFMMYPKPVPQEELDKEQKVNPLMWDTHDILSRIRASLQKEDLEQALRYANQLKGEPRKAASDWINELRLLLETKQAASALMAFAAATVAEDLPAKT